MISGAQAADETSSSRSRLYRNRDFMLLWAGQLISTIGTRVSGLAFPLLVLAITHSAAKAGLVGFMQTVPLVALFPFAGAIIDRGDRKRMMLVCDGTRALALGSIAATYLAGVLSFAQILAVAAIEGACFAFFNIAEGAALPHVVPKEQIASALAQNEARVQGASLAGRPLGGVLFGVSAAAPFIADAASYLASLIGIFFIRAPLRAPSRADRREPLLRDVVSGFAWLCHEQFLRRVVFVAAFANFLFAALGLALIVRARNLGASPALIGVMLAFYGAGGIVGSLFAPAVARRFGSWTVVSGSIWIWSLGTTSMIFIREPILLGVAASVMTAMNAPFNVVVGKYRYELVPNELMGRFQSAVHLIAFAAIPLGTLAVGLLLSSLGARGALAFLAALIASAAALATILPRKSLDSRSA